MDAVGRWEGLCPLSWGGAGGCWALRAGQPLCLRHPAQQAVAWEVFQGQCWEVPGAAMGVSWPCFGTPHPARRGGARGGLGQAQHSASSQAQGCRSISSLLLSHGCSGPEASETLWELWRGSCWEPSCSSACLDAATSPLSLLRKRRIILKKICVCVRVQGCIWPARAAAA